MTSVVISDIEWHDTEIGCITVESSKDAYDTIKIQLISKSFIKDYQDDKVWLILSEVFKARFELNMWVSGKDLIDQVQLLDDSVWIKDTHEKYEIFGPDKFRHFIITTNTNSKIEFLITKELLIGV